MNTAKPSPDTPLSNSDDTSSAPILKALSEKLSGIVADIVAKMHKPQGWPPQTLAERADLIREFSALFAPHLAAVNSFAPTPSVPTMSKPQPFSHIPGVVYPDPDSHITDILCKEKVLPRKSPCSGEPAIFENDEWFYVEAVTGNRRLWALFPVKVWAEAWIKEMRHPENFVVKQLLYP